MRPLAIVCLILTSLVSAPVEGQFAGFDRWLAPPGRYSNDPHPSVARIIVPEVDGTAYGSGTLIDKRDQYGLVLTNWHVVEGASSTIEVQFPDGFRSQARALKVDSDWDLAALVIWKPNCEPVPLASRAPQPGDILTICGYGSGDFRRATGRCTQYYSPQINLPRELVELDVEARQGDSGGPILNEQGELAGVLFGAGRGTTLGSFEGRVKTFLATLAPDIGLEKPVTALAAGAPHQETPPTPSLAVPTPVPQDLGAVALGRQPVAAHDTGAGSTGCPNGTCPVQPAQPPLQWGPAPEANEVVPEAPKWPELKPPTPPTMGLEPIEASAASPVQAEAPLTAPGWFDSVRNALALIGALALLVQGIKLAR